MDADTYISRFGLVPQASDLPAIRKLIRSLTDDSERDGNETLKTLCIQLFSAADVADSLLIYGAKTSSFDADCYIDVQLVCGAGLTSTLAWLAGNDEVKAVELMKYLHQCIASGDFEGFLPEEHLNFYRRYYGLTA